MGFASNLASSQGGDIFGQPGPSNNSETLGIVNQLKNREMGDFKEKSRYMADLSLKQERLRALYNPDNPMDQSGQSPQNQKNVVMGQDPNQMTGYEKGELGIRQQGIGLEQQKLAQSGKMGEERLGIQSAQEKLNQQKSDQINTTKQADLERKTEEANNKLQLAQQALNSKNTNAEAQLQAHKDMNAAMEERHKLELAQKDLQFNTAKDQHDKQIKLMEDRLKQSGNSKTTTELDASGNKKTVTTQKGGTIQVKGKDGNTYEIPADKEEEWNSTHAPQDSEPLDR